MTRRTQKTPNENGIGRGRIRHTPKGDLQHKCRRGSGPPLEPVVMSHDWGTKNTKKGQRHKGPSPERDLAVPTNTSEEARRVGVKWNKRRD